MSDKQLKEQTAVLKKRLEKGESIRCNILNDAFAVVREAATRTLKQRHFDVQLIGGMVLHEGNVAEMKTGEGKTLVATLPVYLNAWKAKGVHVVTLTITWRSAMPAGWARFMNFLGLSVGVIIPDESFVYDPEFKKRHFDARMQHLKPAHAKKPMPPI
jgi:preprotein translocase subunit SecA